MTYYAEGTSAPNRGKLITIEGIDGAGKSTAVATIATLLSEANKPYFETKEPISPFRELVLENPISSKSQLYVFIAARAEAVRTIINPQLDQGVNVICDRYVDSTIAYQVHGNELPLEEVLPVLESESKYTPEPDLTIWLDIPLEEMRSRVSNPDVIESRSDEFYNRVISGYQKLDDSNRRIVRVDGTLPPSEVAENISDIVRSFIDGWDE